MQLVDDRDEFDSEHWGPGIYYKKNGGMLAAPPMLKLKDGTLVHSLVVNLNDGKKYQSGLLLGRWKDDLSGLYWEFSDYVSISPDQSSQGVCESTPCLLDDGRIYLSLRACGDRIDRKFPSLKFWVMSEDGGRTFSNPAPLTYEDGSMVWSPSSMHVIIRHSINKKYYWLGNILDEPNYDSGHRYPLCAAELVPEKGCLIKESVTVIETRPEDCPCDSVRYTNFGVYEDRMTNEIVLTLPEQFRHDRADFTADCYRYRISV